jgi:hypothetical protein
LASVTGKTHRPWQGKGQALSLFPFFWGTGLKIRITRESVFDFMRPITPNIVKMGCLAASYSGFNKI